MPTNTMLQQRIISRVVAQQPEEAVRLAIELWESIAAELIPVIGEDGFAIIYARSIYLSRPGFPWLAIEQTSQQADSQFAALMASLDSRTSSEISDASQALFITFTDILAALIGETLTTGILRSIWGDDASEITSKDFNHE